MNKDDNPYEILGVPMDSEEKDVKKAYRKLAMKYHPDKQTTEEEKLKANDMFSRIADAYDTLTDPIKRYDWRQANEGKMKSVTTASPRTSSSSTGPAPPPPRSSASHTPPNAVRRTQPPNGSVRRPGPNSPGPHRTSGSRSPGPGARKAYGTYGPPSAHTAGRHSPVPSRPKQPGGPGVDPLRNSYHGPQSVGSRPSANRQQAPRVRKKSRDPFLIFEEVMREEFGKDYRKKVASEWNQEESPNDTSKPAPSALSLFGGNKSADKKDVPSYKEMFKDFDLNGDALLSREELRKFVASNEGLFAVLAKSLNMNPNVCIDISTDVALTLAKASAEEDAPIKASIIPKKSSKPSKEDELSRDEFKAFYKNYVQSQKGSYDFFLRTIFAVYDTNGDGVLQRREFENFLEIFYKASYPGKQDMPRKTDLARIAGGRLDKDKDGVLSFEDVRDLLQVAAYLTEKDETK